MFILRAIDNTVSMFMPVWFRIVFFGLLGGFLFTTLYLLLSPQKKLREYKQKAKVARIELSEYDGEPSGLPPMIWASLKYALLVFLLTVLPLCVASMPVIVLSKFTGNEYTDGVLPFGPQWLRGWATLYFSGVILVSITLRRIFRIQ